MNKRKLMYLVNLQGINIALQNYEGNIIKDKVVWSLIMIRTLETWIYKELNSSI